jgi:hypothetical protein
MDDVPLDVVKYTLLLLNVRDLLQICQVDMRLYNICRSDEFWFQYVISKHQNMPINIIRELKKEHTGYKQIAIELDRGIVAPVVNRSLEPISYKIVNYNKSFNDNFLQMVVDASHINSCVTLNGRNWTIFINIRYANQNYPYDPLFMIPRYQPTYIYTMPVILSDVIVGGSMYKIPHNIPMKNIKKKTI